MKMKQGTTLLLNVLTIAGIMIIAFGYLFLNGEAQSAFGYLGGGTTALTAVIQVEYYRHHHELKKAEINHDRMV